jgi:hypothetical protein
VTLGLLLAIMIDRTNAVIYDQLMREAGYSELWMRTTNSAAERWRLGLNLVKVRLALLFRFMDSYLRIRHPFRVQHVKLAAATTVS